VYLRAEQKSGLSYRPGRLCFKIYNM
jgi:hypothetical protein